MSQSDWKGPWSSSLTTALKVYFPMITAFVSIGTGGEEDVLDGPVGSVVIDIAVAGKLVYAQLLAGVVAAYIDRGKVELAHTQYPDATPRLGSAC